MDIDIIKTILEAFPLVKDGIDFAKSLGPKVSEKVSDYQKSPTEDLKKEILEILSEEIKKNPQIGQKIESYGNMIYGGSKNRIAGGRYNSIIGGSNNRIG